MAHNIFEQMLSALDSPASHAFAITPSNSTNFTVPARAFYVGVGGDVAIVTIHDEVVTLSNVVAGSIVPVRVKRINSTNTTASLLVGLY